MSRCRRSRLQDHGIGVAGGVLVAHLDTAVLLEPDLPEEVPGQPDDPAARLDEGVDGVAHLPAPVLVVPDQDERAVAIEETRELVEVVLRGDVHRVALALGPAHEVALVRRPAGGAGVLRLAHGPAPLGGRVVRHPAERQVVRVGLARRALGQVQGGPAPRSLERELRARPADALVVAAAAPVVVGGPGGGGADQQQPVGRAPRGPDGEPAVGRPGALGPQRHQVPARRPVRADRQLERHRPGAAVGEAVRRGVRLGAGQPVLRVHQDAPCAVPLDRQLVARGGAVDVQPGRLARGVREPVEVAVQVARLAGRRLVPPAFDRRPAVVGPRLRADLDQRHQTVGAAGRRASGHRIGTLAAARWRRPGGSAWASRRVDEGVRAERLATRCGGRAHPARMSETAS